MNDLIFLIGFMGSGKSTVGRKLARELNYDFIDLDDSIENKYRISIPDIFSRFDEKAFRVLETKVLQDTFVLRNHVISTGGGTPCHFDNMKQMNNHGKTIYLKLHPKSLHVRLIHAKKKRPLIQEKHPDDIIQFIEEKLEEREEYYNHAHLIVKGEDIDIKLLAYKILQHSDD